MEETGTLLLCAKPLAPILGTGPRDNTGIPETVGASRCSRCILIHHTALDHTGRPDGFGTSDRPHDELECVDQPTECKAQQLALSLGLLLGVGVVLYLDCGMISCGNCTRTGGILYVTLH